MKTIAMISSHPGAGQTTLAVNLTSGLVQKGYRVLIGASGDNHKLYNYLGIEAEPALLRPSQDTQNNRIQASRLGIDWLDLAPKPDKPAEPASVFAIMENTDYDYLFFIPTSRTDCDLLSKLSEHLLICIDFRSDKEVENLIALEKYLQALSGKSKVISLIIPNKINSKEWAHNSRQLFALTDFFEIDRIADPIPACERVHDLPQQGHTVWQLDRQNLQEAFRRLVEAVEML